MKTLTANTPLRTQRPPARVQPAELPVIQSWKLRLFRIYVRRHLQRHFHAVRLATAGRPALPPDQPAVVYLNHASWWDPLICLFLIERMFPSRPAYAPIEAAQLERYGILRGLGFFGIEPGTARGGLTFLRTSAAILAGPQNMLWLTPQGRFADPRERPVLLQEGLGHLALRAPGTVFVPLALEYPFWNERLPEALARFGEPVASRDLPLHSGIESVSRALGQRLEAAQNALASDAQSRQPAHFDLLHGGAAGVGGIYDTWRRWKARWRGERFAAEHRPE